MFKDKKILVVDDEEILFTIIKAELSNLGCQVEYAANGRIGLEAIQKSMPDLVITDLIMLEMTGMELLRCLFERQMKVPTILMTGFGNIKTLKEAYSLGVFDFLEKPLRLPELRSMVIKALTYYDEKLGKGMVIERDDQQGSFRFLSLHLEEELFQDLEARCHQQGTSITTLIKSLLKQHFRSDQP